MRDIIDSRHSVEMRSRRGRCHYLVRDLDGVKSEMKTGEEIVRESLIVRETGVDTSPVLQKLYSKSRNRNSDNESPIIIRSEIS